jgi:hypothetical protein
LFPSSSVTSWSFVEFWNLVWPKSKCYRKSGFCRASYFRLGIRQILDQPWQSLHLSHVRFQEDFCSIHIRFPKRGKLDDYPRDNSRERVADSS